MSDRLMYSIGWLSIALALAVVALIVWGANAAP